MGCGEVGSVVGFLGKSLTLTSFLGPGEWDESHVPSYGGHYSLPFPLHSATHPVSLVLPALWLLHSLQPSVYHIFLIRSYFYGYT